jgi:small subunit ribosomal protein S1
LEENPWDELAAKYGVDTVVAGKVAEVTDKGAVVVLEEGVEGYCTARHLQKEDKAATTVGEELNFKVIEFNRDAKRILLSHLRTWEERKEAPVKEVKAKKEKEAQPELPKMEKTTLGDLGALADLHASLAAEKPAKAKKATKKEETAE